MVQTQYVVKKQQLTAPEEEKKVVEQIIVTEEKLMMKSAKVEGNAYGDEEYDDPSQYQSLEGYQKV